MSSPLAFIIEKTLVIYVPITSLNDFLFHILKINNLKSVFSDFLLFALVSRLLEFGITSMDDDFLWGF